MGGAHALGQSWEIRRRRRRRSRRQGGWARGRLGGWPFVLPSIFLDVGSRAFGKQGEQGRRNKDVVLTGGPRARTRSVLC